MTMTAAVNALRPSFDANDGENAAGQRAPHHHSLYGSCCPLYQLTTRTVTELKETAPKKK